MIELFTKQGVSIPITTMMVWDAYRHVKQGGEASRYRWYDVGVSSYSPQQTIVRVVGLSCIRKLFSKDHPVSHHP